MSITLCSTSWYSQRIVILALVDYVKMNTKELFQNIFRMETFEHLMDRNFNYINL